MSRNANHCVMWSFYPGTRCPRRGPQDHRFKLGQVLTNLHWSVVCCLLLVSDLILPFWPNSQSLGWRNQSSTNWPTAFRDDGVYKSVRRIFSYAPRKMNPPMLMNVTLGMLPANSLQTWWENIKARVSNNSLFKLVNNKIIWWSFTIKNTSTFVEKRHSIKIIQRHYYNKVKRCHEKVFAPFLFL